LWHHTSLRTSLCRRRLNVALTRARRGLIVICDPSTLKSDRVWRAWLEWASRQGLVLPAPLPLPASMKGPQRGLPLPRGQSPSTSGSSGQPGVPAPSGMKTGNTVSTFAAVDATGRRRLPGRSQLPLPTPQTVKVDLEGRAKGQGGMGGQGGEDGFFEDSTFLASDDAMSFQDQAVEEAVPAMLGSRGRKQPGARPNRSQQQGRRGKQSQQGPGKAGRQEPKQGNKVEVTSWPMY
jgi:hypothetical protein